LKRIINVEDAETHSGKNGVRPEGYVAEKNKSYSGAYDDEDGASVAAVLKRGEC
jgi:hypothetical protein